MHVLIFILLGFMVNSDSLAKKVRIKVKPLYEIGVVLKGANGRKSPTDQSKILRIFKGSKIITANRKTMDGNWYKAVVMREQKTYWIKKPFLDFSKNGLRKCMKEQCKKGDGARCNGLAAELAKVGKHQEAIQYAQKSCELKSADGCFKYTFSLLEKGQFQHAEKIASPLCKKQEHLYSCLLAEIANAKFNFNQALKRLTGECDKSKPNATGYHSCFVLLEYAYWKNQVNQIEKLSKKLCLEGSPIECFMYMNYMKEWKRLTESKQFLKSSCNNNYFASCKALESYYADRDQPKKILPYSKKLCDHMKNAESCAIMVGILFKQGKKEEGKIYLKKACDAGYKKACSTLKKLTP